MKDKKGWYKVPRVGPLEDQQGNIIATYITKFNSWYLNKDGTRLDAGWAGITDATYFAGHKKGWYKAVAELIRRRLMRNEPCIELTDKICKKGNFPRTPKNQS